MAVSIINISCIWTYPDLIIAGKSHYQSTNEEGNRKEILSNRHVRRRIRFKHSLRGSNILCNIQYIFLSSFRFISDIFFSLFFSLALKLVSICFYHRLLWESLLKSNIMINIIKELLVWLETIVNLIIVIV